MNKPLKKPRLVRDVGMWCCFSERSYWVERMFFGDIEHISYGRTPVDAYVGWYVKALPVAQRRA